MVYKVSKVRLLRTLLASFIDFVGMLAIWSLLLPHESRSRIGVYTLAFILLSVLVNSAEWLAGRVLKLLHIEEKGDVVVPVPPENAIR